MSEREYKYIDVDRLDTSKLPDIYEEPEDVLYESLLDVMQLAEAEGLSVESVDEVLRRVFDYRAQRARAGFRVHLRKGKGGRRG